MNNKVLIIIFLVILGSVSIFAYPVIKDRYFQSSPTDTEEENLSTDEETEEEDESSNQNENDSGTLPDEQPIDEDVFIEVDQEDCEEGCEQFEDADDKKYCQQYCGIKTDSDVTDDDCEKLEDLEKDYCWKNKAIAEKNFKSCDKIVDKKIKESCKTRLTEDLLNGSNSPLE